MSGTDQVTSVRVAVVAREAQRRLEEVRKMDIWERKKREEAEKSADAQQAIEAEWDKCFKADKGPYAMFEVEEN